nr:phage minor tail protein L [uncultured Mediterranean phage uvMED]
MAIPTSALQEINPGSIIELFTIELNTALHGSNTIYRFHNGANMNANGEVVWAGNSYLRFPIECTGFEFGSTGTLPRPRIAISNIFGTITAIMQDINTTTVGNDLNGAKFTRIRTLARFLDAVNFAPETVTSTSTTTVADPADGETVTYTVTVVTDGNGDNVFAINGVQKPVITMKRGSTYIFNQSHSSNVNHPLRIKSDAGGIQTTVNAGTLGTDATVTYSPAYPTAPNDLRYYCLTHGNNMGNTITMNNPNTIQQQTTSSSTTQTNPYGTPDPTAEFPQEIYFLDRKVTENRNVVTWEAQSALDLVNVKLPKRIATKDLFPGIGAFVG